MGIVVTEWISYDDADGSRETSIGGMGGFFNSGGKDGMRWSDYIDGFGDTALEHLEALRKEIVAKKIRNGGFWHQGDHCGVPMFSDGTVATYSMRGWGDLLAAIWSEEDGKGYSYQHFAWER